MAFGLSPADTLCLKRGLKRLCPHCGKAKIFIGWYRLHEVCPHCGLTLKAREGDCWAFLYVTTAGLIGVLLVLMLLFFHALSHATSLIFAQALYLAIGILGIFWTLPSRKGLAIAVDYLLDQRWEPPKV
jgi:uncharacterized protein (DUF983 family)